MNMFTAVNCLRWLIRHAHLQDDPQALQNWPHIMSSLQRMGHNPATDEHEQSWQSASVDAKSASGQAIAAEPQPSAARAMIT